MNKGFLQHYGVLGMQWGRRKGGSSSPDHDKAQSLTKKKLDEMSNEELKTVVNRLQLEKQYKQARKRDSSSGQQFVTKLLLGAGAAVATPYITKFMTKGVEKLAAKIAKK